MMEAQVQTRLEGFPDLAALISARVYADELPENTPLPALDVAWASDDAGPAEPGLSGPDHLERHIVEVTVWGETALERMTVSNQVQLALIHWPADDPGYSGRMCDIENAGYDGGKDEETGHYWRSLRFRVLASPLQGS